MTPDIKLKSGRTVTHKQLDNGAHEAFMADGGDMSENEWQEYCQLLRRN